MYSKCCVSEMFSTVRSFMTLHMLGCELIGAWYKIIGALKSPWKSLNLVFMKEWEPWPIDETIPRDRSPVKTSFTQQPSAQILNILNDTNPQYDLWCSMELNQTMLTVWPEENCPPIEPGFPQGPPSISVHATVTSAWLVGHTSYSAILLNWLYWHYWMRTELSCMMTLQVCFTAEFISLHNWWSYTVFEQNWINNEQLLSVCIIESIFPFYHCKADLKQCVLLKCFINKGDSTSHSMG